MNNRNNRMMTNILKNRHRHTMILTILRDIIPVAIILMIPVCIRLHIRIAVDRMYLRAGLIALERSVHQEVFSRGHQVLHRDRDQQCNLHEREWVVDFVRAESIL
jgi:hypothetical protein